jgi:hypothetical protein
MSSTRKSKSIGQIGGKKGVQENIVEDNTRNDGVHVKPSGPEEKVQAAEDMMPTRLNLANPGVEEKFRDTLSMVNSGIYGESNLGGVRPYDPSIESYLADKRDKIVTEKYYDLMMSAFDPLGKIFFLFFFTISFY